MITIFRLALVASILVAPVEALGKNDPSTKSERHSGSSLSWNLKKDEAPFVRQASPSDSGFAGPLAFQAGEFSFPLFQALVFDASANCYSLMVRSGGGLELVSLWRARAGFYRSGNGPYLELENLDSLKSITSLNRTRFIFAQVGDGEWRCVSIHDAVGNYLMIDYRANGLIARLRDSFGRTATPVYDDRRLVALTQVWNANSGEHIRTTSLSVD